MSARRNSLVVVVVAAGIVGAHTLAAPEEDREVVLTVDGIAACCQPPEGRTFSQSPFGLHGARGGQAAAQDLNAHLVRRIVLWQQGEPRPRDYRIAGADGAIRRIQSAGLDLVITLRTTSQWGIDVDYAALREERPGDPWTLFCGPPRDMGAWLAYVGLLVERFDGDGIHDMPGLLRPIRYWQIGNEIRWQWQGTMDQYLDLLHRTAEVIRSADPQAQIILGALTGGLEVARADLAGSSESDRQPHRRLVEGIERVLQQGADDYDIVDFHSYDDTPDDLALLVCWLRQRIAPTSQIWSLENAGPFEDFSTARCSEDLVKRHLILLACGVEGIFWSSLNPTTGWSEPYLRLALLDEAGRTRPAYHTYRLLAGKLDGLTSVDVLDAPRGVRAFRVHRPAGDVFVTWSVREAVNWEIDLQAPVARITQIITEPGKTTPQVDDVATGSGVLSFRVSAPVFVEGMAH